MFSLLEKMIFVRCGNVGWFDKNVYDVQCYNISNGQKIYDVSQRDRFLASSGNTDIWHQTGQTTPDYAHHTIADRQTVVYYNNITNQTSLSNKLDYR